jgi:hypothetical protein
MTRLLTSCMKATSAAAVITVFGLTISPAYATRCLYPERAVAGPIRGTISKAQSAAISAWQAAVSRRHGPRFANWYYSGDRTIQCKWNDRGNKIRCQASAVPCGE